MNNCGPSGMSNCVPNDGMFLGAVACAYNNVKMLAGDPSAEQICFQLTAQDFSLLPADIDSQALPRPARTNF